MKKLLSLCLSCCLCLSAPAPVSAYGGYGGENPFVEAMLRMMEIFGLIDRSSLPLGVPYLPGNTSVLGSGFGGLSGFGGYPGMGVMPGVSPLSLYGMGGAPGMGSLPGMGGVPGMGQFPGMSAWPGAGWGIPNGYGQPTGVNTTGQLDGIWELDKGGFVVIRGSNARLYLSREKFQDFRVGYDRQNLWWTPTTGGTRSRYRYQLSDGRMILRDKEGNYLLLSRRR